MLHPTPPLLLPLLMLVAAHSARGAAADSPSPPNILLIVTDDQGWGDLRAHGNPKIDTPTLDRLAASGVSFDRFYVSPVCAPTRAALLTGRYPERTGVHGVTRGAETMRASERTIAEIFGQAGYATGCFGKWHNGAHFPHDPNAQGFDEFFGFCAGHWNSYFDTQYQHNRDTVRREGYITDVLTDEAIGFIERNAARPFLCYVPYNAPHAPMQVPDRFFGKYKARGLDDMTAAAYGMVESVDENVARLLATLDRLDLASRTIVIFMSDNGPQGDRWNGGMRGNKGKLNEGGVRVPLFIRWPGRILAGRRVGPGAMAAHLDLLPTLAEICKVPLGDGPPLDGRSLATLLAADATSSTAERTLFHERFGRGSVRSGHWLAVEERAGQWRLIDLAADPGETTDLAATHPGTLAGMRAQWQSWNADVTRDGFDPAPVVVGDPRAPRVELPAHEAYLEPEPGSGIAYHGERGYAHDWIDQWTSPEARAWWPVDAGSGAAVDATLLCAVPAGAVGTAMRLEAGDAAIDFTLDEAWDPAPIAHPDRVPRWEVPEVAWKRVPLGRIELRPGRQRLVLRLIRPHGSSVAVKAIILESGD